MDSLREFLRESLRIEGIFRDPTEDEIQATKEFLLVRHLTVEAIEKLVGVYQPDARLRDQHGLDVRVGDYFPPPGDPNMREWLGELLDDITYQHLSPWEAHCNYELLHPFTDGNGRSGRAIWLWQHSGHAPLGFLHQFYYETLGSSPVKASLWGD